jgi:hypothetical protein
MLYSTRKRASSTQACARLQNSCSFRHSSRSRLLNESPKPFYHSLTGVMWKVSMLVSASQSTTSEAMNSPLLSDRMTAGEPSAPESGAFPMWRRAGCSLFGRTLYPLLTIGGVLRAPPK